MDISAVTPTICQLMGIAEPAVCTARPLEPVLAAAPYVVTRVLSYLPDAIGRVFLNNRPDLKKQLVAASDVQVELQSVLPPKTPVCFASMLTGAPPEVHGIRKYERPVLTCDTLFDALARAGKRAAIVAVKDCSVDIIFRNRPIDYFTQESDQQVIELALGLVRADKHDFIVAYNQEYDDTLHRTTHDGPEAEAAAARHVATFGRLCAAVDQYWHAHSRASFFAPDHGAHFDAAKGRGDHGEDRPEDMDLVHFWRIRAGG